jgi:hypothetical protein
MQQDNQQFEEAYLNIIVHDLKQGSGTKYGHNAIDNLAKSSTHSKGPRGMAGNDGTHGAVQPVQPILQITLDGALHDDGVHACRDSHTTTVGARFLLL